MTVSFRLASAIGMALKCHQGYIHFTSKLSFLKHVSRPINIRVC